MVDRKRRYSTVSADDRDDVSKGYTNEKNVLKLPTNKTDPDDWPCYLIEESSVVDEDGKNYENLLHAELEGPYTVRGRLIFDSQYRKNCKELNLGFQQV